MWLQFEFTNSEVFIHCVLLGTTAHLMQQ